MPLDDQERKLYEIVKGQLGDSPSLEQVQSTVSAVAGILNLDQETVCRVIDEFRLASPPPVIEYHPRLFVDWGEMPRVGHQCRPEFSLLCPAYSGRPEVWVKIDDQLDHHSLESHVRCQNDGAGLWAFHVPFSMTSQGQDCRPGHYIIAVQVTFRDIPPDLPRFFCCRIRLHIQNHGESDRGVLEIDGDGQSIVNLQGYDLRQFSKVILKGGSDGVINIANSFTPEKATSPLLDKLPTTFEYQLKIDPQKQDRLPKVLQRSKQRDYLDSGAFFLEDGRRILISTGPKISFGRSRDNDVILRFLPRSEENDRHSGNISRTHFIAELTQDGYEILDKSRSGIEVEYAPVRERHIIRPDFAGETIHVDIGATGQVSKKFEMQAILFLPDSNDDREEREYWDELICEILGGRLSRTARLSLDVGLDAARFDRVTSLAGEEHYVHLFRQVLVGGSPGQCGVLLRESGPQVQARLLHIDRSFWLEALPGCRPISIDNTPLPPRTISSLTPGMEIVFGSERMKFDKPSQLYLD